ncbi:hypothetical protein [Salegentibacter chungangensis]|uniref:Uncharacterized protein n=1 Tax=Salegentibacter chungangensis TaxID=1335724 RepID=A0ABW3NWL0_9FLAO
MKGFGLTCRFLGFCALTLLMVSCVKDVDLGQGKEIQLTPDIQTDLLIYTVEKKDLIDSENGEIKQAIRDTVRLEFLDDDYIQNDLFSAELYFSNTNTFSQAFTTRISFLSESGAEQFSVNYDIPAGTEASPSSAEALEVVEEDRIHLLRNSIKMVVELQMQSAPGNLEGQLDFDSTGLFKFEF